MPLISVWILRLAKTNTLLIYRSLPSKRPSLCTVYVPTPPPFLMILWLVCIYVIHIQMAYPCKNLPPFFGPWISSAHGTHSGDYGTYRIATNVLQIWLQPRKLCSRNNIFYVDAHASLHRSQANSHIWSVPKYEHITVLSLSSLVLLHVPGTVTVYCPWMGRSSRCAYVSVHVHVVAHTYTCTMAIHELYVTKCSRRQMHANLVLYSIVSACLHASERVVTTAGGWPLSKIYYFASTIFTVGVKYLALYRCSVVSRVSAHGAWIHGPKDGGGHLHGEAICIRTTCEPYALMVLSLCVQGTHKVVERMINMEDVQKAVKENRVSGVDWGRMHWSTYWIAATGMFWFADPQWDWVL